MSTSDVFITHFYVEWEGKKFIHYLKLQCNYNVNVQWQRPNVQISLKLGQFFFSVFSDVPPNSRRRRSVSQKSETGGGSRYKTLKNPTILQLKSNSYVQNFCHCFKYDRALSSKYRPLTCRVSV